jgi:hypothetical protein
MNLTFRGTKIGLNERIEGIGVKVIDNEMFIITKDGDFPIIPSTLRISGVRDFELISEPRMTDKQIEGLHETIMSSVITYLRDNEIKGVDEVGFRVDGLEPSVEMGYWTPATDSSINIYGFEDGKKKDIGHRI